MSIEAFLTSQIAPNLVPPERILGCAFLRRPRTINAFGVPQNYDDYLGVATDRRLVVFETEAGGLLTPTAKPVARNPIVWTYDELATVSLGEVNGVIVHSGGRARTLYLSPIAGLGPYPAKDPTNQDEMVASGRRYDVYAQIDGLPGQMQFMDQFLPWLDGQFKAGALAPSPSRRQEFDARLAGLRAAAEAERQRRAAASAAQKPKLIKGAIGGVGGLVALGGLILTLWGVSDALKRAKMLDGFDTAIEIEEKDLAWSRGNTPMPAGCPEQSVGKSLPMVQYTCHGCDRDSYSSSNGYKSVKRGSESFSCPPPAVRERSIAQLHDSRDHTMKNIFVAVGSAIGGVILLAASVIGALLGMRSYGRRLAAAGSPRATKQGAV